MSSQQAAVLTNFSSLNAARFIGFGTPAAYSPSTVADDSNIYYPCIDITRNNNSSTDFIWENNSYPETTASTNGAVTGVVEHLLHTITEFGYGDAAGTLYGPAGAGSSSGGADNEGNHRLEGNRGNDSLFGSSGVDSLTLIGINSTLTESDFSFI
ncbi:MAG: hypothetical protein VW057_11685 [Rhodospirillaceae bacterium]